jgi:3,4-dihydroxy 2-butanone 4-phosphate synthase/GTP cyclohydrolase II
MAGLEPVAVICEITNPDGSMARLPELRKFAAYHRLRMITVRDLIAYRMAREKLVERVASAKFPTRYGEFTIHGYRARFANVEADHVALTMGDVADGEPVLVRVHSECLTGDTLGSLRCDCGDQIQAALQRIAEEGRGVLLYLRQEGRGIGLVNKLRAYELQDQGLDTVAANERLGFRADQRDYRLPAEVLKYLGATRIRLLSNNPEKVQGLEREGIRVDERVALEIAPSSSTRGYLKIKKEKLGHILSKV